MVEGFLEGESPEGVPAKHPTKQVNTTLTERLKNSLYVIFLVHSELLNFLAEVMPGFLKELGPVALSGVADKLADELELMDLGVALEEGRALPQELTYDAADGPHIHAFTVLPDSEEQLGGTVPEGDYFASEGLQRLFYKFS